MQTLPSDSSRRNEEAQTAPRKAAWPVHLIWAVVALAFAAIPIYFLWSARSTADSLQDEFHSALNAAFGGEVTHRFYSSAPELSEGNGLVLASLRMSESFERIHVARFLGIEGVSEARIDLPVSYHYQVPWDSGWRVLLTQSSADSVSGKPATQLCIVEAPALEPLLPPAIHTDEMRIRRVKEWRLQRFDQASVDALLKEITPLISTRARSKEYRLLVRETARKRLEDFVRQWVLQLDEIPPDLHVEIFVSFADDAEPAHPDGIRLLREFEIQ